MKVLLVICRRLPRAVAVLMAVTLALGAVVACTAGEDAPAVPETLEGGEAEVGALPGESGMADDVADVPAAATVAGRSEPPPAGDAADSALTAEEGDVAGMYAASLAAAGAAGLDLVLDLAADGVAQLVTDYSDGQPTAVEIGTWQGYPDGSLTVVLTTRIGHGEQAVPTAFVFRHAGAALVATEWDEQLFGPEAPRLVRQAAP